MALLTEVQVRAIADEGGWRSSAAQMLRRGREIRAGGDEPVYAIDGRRLVLLTESELSDPSEEIAVIEEN